MIEVKCGIRGFAMQPKIEYGAKRYLTREITINSGGLAFVDLVFVREINCLISSIGRSDNLRMYIDHHAPYDQSLSFPVCKFGTVILKRRDAAPSCCELVEPGCWKINQVGTVFFHDDIDGFYSFIRGCGFEYPEMLSDVRKIDSGVGESPLSKVGLTVLNLLDFSNPGFSSPQGEYTKARTNCYCRLIEWFQTGKNSDELDRLFEESMELKNAAERRAKYVAKHCVSLFTQKSDIVKCDLRDHIISEYAMDLAVLKQKVSKQFKKAKVIGIIFKTPFGSKVLIITLGDNGVNLRKFIHNNHGRWLVIPRKAIVPIDIWPQFIRSWENRRVK